MHAFILQDWTTIRGAVTTIVQQETDWLDLSPYQDVVFWIDVKESTNSPTFTLQTSPSKDDSLFTAMIPGSNAGSGTLTIQSAFMTTANVPLARFVRWQISGAPTWDATFRILVAANSPGM
jgi:hypothetical protein